MDLYDQFLDSEWRKQDLLEQQFEEVSEAANEAVTAFLEQITHTQVVELFWLLPIHVTDVVFNVHPNLDGEFTEQGHNQLRATLNTQGEAHTAVFNYLVENLNQLDYLYQH